MSDSTPRVAEYTARLREHMAFARGRCAALHELDLEDRELPCAECRQRGTEVYAAPSPDPERLTP